MMINNFLKSKINNKLKKSSKKYRSYIFKEAYMMDKFGVNDEKSLIRFHYASQYVPMFVKQICGEYDKKVMSSLLSYVMNYNINSSNDIREKVAKYFSNFPIIKKSYPNYGEDIIPKKYDMNKWRTALNDIIIKERLYGNSFDVTNQVIKDWSSMDEKMDFKNWAKDQKQGIGKLYRTALFEEKPMEMQYIPGLTSRPKKSQINIVNEKSRDEVVKQKVLGRINSIKKILSTKDGPHLLGKDYSKIMKSILDLEGDILGIRTSSMIEDVLIRTAGYLEKENCDDTIVDFIKKTAQMPSLNDMSPDIGQPQENEESESSDEGKKALDTFIERLRGYPVSDMNPDKIKDNFEEIVDNLEKKLSWYDINTKEVVGLENIAEYIFKIAKIVKFTKRNEKVKTAQEALDEPPAEPVATENEVVDKVDNTVDDTENHLSNKTKAEVDDLFANIKLSDVISRLEALSKVFQNREIARQLSIIDLMLDSLGLSGFFPSLAEATRSALESNQYCQTRVEEILSRLVSSVNDQGDSLIDTTKLENKKTRNPSLIDNEMEEYLNEVPEVKNEPAPVEEVAEEAVIPKKVPEKPKPVVPQPKEPTVPVPESAEREVPIAPAV